MKATEWHRVTSLGPLAEIAGEYLKNSSQVDIEGRLRARKWKGKESDADRYTTEIVTKTMQIPGSRTEGSACRGRIQARKRIHGRRIQASILMHSV